MKKSKTIDDVKKTIIKDWFECTDRSQLSSRDQERLDGFVKSYKPEVLISLNSIQLVMLSYMFEKQDQDTDHLSFALGLPRRSAVNTANALVRKNLLWWDYPTTSNADGGMVLMLKREAMVTEEYLALF